MVKVEEPDDLIRRAFTLACEMFGKKHVTLYETSLIKIKPSSIGSDFKDIILVASGDVEPASGIVCVLSPDYFDEAMKFAERYESEVIGRKDGVILRKKYI